MHSRKHRWVPRAMDLLIAATLFGETCAITVQVVVPQARSRWWATGKASSRRVTLPHALTACSTTNHTEMDLLLSYPGCKPTCIFWILHPHNTQYALDCITHVRMGHPIIMVQDFCTELILSGVSDWSSTSFRSTHQEDVKGSFQLFTLSHSVLLDRAPGTIQGIYLLYRCLQYIVTNLILWWLASYYLNWSEW